MLVCAEAFCPFFILFYYFTVFSRGLNLILELEFFSVVCLPVPMIE